MNTKTPSTGPWTRASQAWSGWLERLSARERRAVLLATWTLGLGLAWWLAVAPALQVLRGAPERHARLDTQLALMQRLSASAEQVRALNSSPPPGRAAAIRALEQSVAQLGSGARLSLQGDQASLTLTGTSAAALAGWLSQMRINARLVPVQAQLRYQDSPAGWSGQLVMSSPSLQAEP